MRWTRRRAVRHSILQPSYCIGLGPRVLHVDLLSRILELPNHAKDDGYRIVMTPLLLNNNRAKHMETENKIEESEPHGSSAGW